MALLLDTHTFLWYYQGNSLLSDTSRKAIQNSDGAFYVSIASFWEITIKFGLGRLSLDASLEAFFQDVFVQGYRIAPIDFSHFIQYNQLPLHHRDPFDRLIVAQAMAENWNLISKDEILDQYLTGTL